MMTEERKILSLEEIESEELTNVSGGCNNCFGFGKRLMKDYGLSSTDAAVLLSVHTWKLNGASLEESMESVKRTEYANKAHLIPQYWDIL